MCVYLLTYEQVQDARVAAARSGDWSITPLQSARSLGSGDAAKIVVKFKVGGRTFEEEIVDNISAAAAKAVLSSIANGSDEGAKEMIKPHVAAQVNSHIRLFLFSMFNRCCHV